MRNQQAVQYNFLPFSRHSRSVKFYKTSCFRLMCTTNAPTFQVGPCIGVIIKYTLSFGVALSMLKHFYSTLQPATLISLLNYNV